MANKPNGNLTGIKSAMLDRLKSLYDFKQGLDEFASFELLSGFAPAPAKSTARFPSIFPVTAALLTFR